MLSSKSGTPPKIEEISNLFPSYHILQVIATGGMGTVYLAEHKMLKRKTAIKVLNQETAKDQRVVDAFLLEAQTMSMISHSNVVLIYDHGIVNGHYFIIMEYIDGKSLHYSAYQKRIDPEVVLELMIGVARGVAATHEANIIHRDIKPSNIVLTQAKHPKLCDFGLAHPVNQLETKSYTTQGYSAPETYNNPEKIGKQCDIYSLGIIFYELLTGAVPNLQSYIHPSQLVPVSPTVDSIVAKCLQAEPEHRYENARKLVEKLLDLRYMGILVSGTQSAAGTSPLAQSIAPAPPTALMR